MTVEQESADKEDILSHLQVVRDLLEQGRREDAFYQLRKISHLHLDDWRLQFEFGVRYFQIGSLDRSEWALRQSLSRNADNATALRYLSALLSQKGDRSGAEQTARVSTQINPIIPPDRHEPDRPTVLRLRSIEKSYHAITWNTDQRVNECGLRRGHFSTRALIDRESVNLYTATILGNNLIDHEGLPPFDLIVNTVSCADLKQSALSDVQRFIDCYPGIPVTNPPSRVVNTTRYDIAERLRAVDGIRMPRAFRTRVDASADELTMRILDDGLELPLIVREAGTQTGSTVALHEQINDLKTALSKFDDGTEIYAIQYVDCLGSDGYFHKTRAFFVDGVFYPVANLTSDHWQIHSGDRYRVMDKLPHAQKAERAYLADPLAYLGDDNFRRLAKVSEIIGLDFFGIDFTINKGGQLVIFEANAAMRHNFDHAENFPYTAPYLRRISDAFMSMVQNRIAVAGKAIEGSARPVAERESAANQ